MFRGDGGWGDFFDGFIIVHFVFCYEEDSFYDFFIIFYEISFFCDFILLLFYSLSGEMKYQLSLSNF